MRKILLLLIFLLASPCWADCIAHWKMNDNTATATVVDAMGSHNGTYHGTGGTDDYTDAHSVAGKINTALDFDGTPDYIEIADHNDFTFGDGTNDSPFSISTWVYMDKATNVTVIDKAAINQDEWFFHIDNNGYLQLLLYHLDVSVYWCRT